MPVIIKVSNKKIYASIVNAKDKFYPIIGILKNNKCFFEGVSKRWVIPIYSYPSVVEEVSKIDTVSVPDEFKSELNDLIHPKPTIDENQIHFSLSDLKYPPIKGKGSNENYQLEDIIKCASRNRYALFNEQGTGKSYIICSALELLRKYKGLRKVVVITSSSGVYNFKKEIEKFTNFDPSTITIGDKFNRRPFDDKSVHIIITNYRSFLLISDTYQKDINDVKNYRKTPIPVEEWIDGDKGAIVLDESHNIANPKARQTKAIHLIADYFYYRYILTGTPADREEKYYSQLRFLDPFLVKNMGYYEWLQYYADLGNKFSAYAINYFFPHKLKELQKIVSDTCSKRLAAECIELPEHYIKPIYVKFTPQHKKIYESFVMGQLSKMGNYLESRSIVNKFPYLILAIDNPYLLLNHSETLDESVMDLSYRFNFVKDHSKIETLLNLVEEHPDEKIVLWNSHPSVGNILFKIFEEKGYNPLLIHGEVDYSEFKTMDMYKDHVVRKFNSDPSHKILIAGIQTLSTAVTLTSASVQIFFDTTFNYTDFNQSLFRVHRISQTKPVTTYILVIDNSLDVVRYMNLKEKDFITKNFLKKEYIDSKLAKKIFMATDTSFDDKD